MTLYIGDGLEARTARMWRELPAEARLALLAVGIVVHLEEEGNDMPGGLEQLLAELHDAARQAQAEAFG